MTGWHRVRRISIIAFGDAATRYELTVDGTILNYVYALQGFERWREARAKDGRHYEVCLETMLHTGPVITRWQYALHPTTV